MRHIKCRVSKYTHINEKSHELCQTFFPSPRASATPLHVRYVNDTINHTALNPYTLLVGDFSFPAIPFAGLFLS